MCHIFSLVAMQQIITKNKQIMCVGERYAWQIWELKLGFYYTGMDVDWIEAPPLETKEFTPFTASFSLNLSPEFYSWAVQDAQDNFKKNLFLNLDGSERIR